MGNFRANHLFAYLASVSLATAIVFGPLRMLYLRLIPWWVFGSARNQEAVTVADVHGRLLVFSNEQVVRDDAIAGLTLLYVLSSGIVLVLMLSAAQRLTRRMEGKRRGQSMSKAVRPQQ